MKKIFAACCWLTLFGPAALAHGTKEGSVPSDGDTLASAPEVIQMTFDDPMRITFVELLGADGGAVPLTRKTGLDPTQVFEATPEALGPGRYTFQWRGLASDGHAMEGRFSFVVAP